MPKAEENSQGGPGHHRSDAQQAGAAGYGTAAGAGTQAPRQSNPLALPLDRAQTTSAECRSSTRRLTQCCPLSQPRCSMTRGAGAKAKQRSPDNRRLRGTALRQSRQAKHLLPDIPHPRISPRLASLRSALSRTGHQRGRHVKSKERLGNPTAQALRGPAQPSQSGPGLLAIFPRLNADDHSALLVIRSSR